MGLDDSQAATHIDSTDEDVPLFAGVKVVFFDLDDTLCAYWNAAKKGLRLTFEEHPEHGTTATAMIEHWGEVFREFAPTIKHTHWYEKYLESGEITRIELMRRTLERVGNYDENLAEQLSNTYYVERHAALELFPEALGVLQRLHGTFELGLITNGPADIQRQEIATLGIADMFGCVLIEGETKKGKPNPEVMRMAEEQTGCKGAQVLFVGNSYKHDVCPAREAGWRQAWVRRPSDVPPTSQRTGPEGLPEGEPEPDMTIEDLRELLPALGVES